MTLQELKDKIDTKAWNLRSRMNSLSAKTIYGFVGAMAFWPIFQMAQLGDQQAIAAFTGMLSAMGFKVVTDKLTEWKNKAVNEKEVVELLERELQKSPDFRKELSTLVEKLEVLPLFRESLQDEDGEWFDELLKNEREAIEARNIQNTLNIGTVHGSVQHFGNVQGDVNISK